MSKNFNIGFLKTVQQPILDSLKKAQENIDNNLVSSQEKGLIGSVLEISAINEIHSAKGALQMIDLPGVVLVLSKIQDLLKQVNDTSSTNNVVNSLNVSSNAIKNIIYYIEHLSAGEQDRPMKLFDDYQIVCGLLNKEVNPKDLFFPKLDILKDNQKDLELFFKVDNNFDEQRLFKTITELKNISNSANFEKSILEVCELVTQVKSAFENNKVEKVTGLMFIQGIQDKLVNIKKSLNLLLDFKINKHYNTIFNLYINYIACLEPNNNQHFPQDYNNRAKEIKFNLLKLSAELRILIKELEEIMKKNPGEKNQLIRKIKTSKDVQKELLYSLIMFFIERPILKEIKESVKLSSYIDLNDYIEQLSSKEITVSLNQKDNSSLEFLFKTLTDIKEEFIAINAKEQKSDPSVFMKKLHFGFTKLNEQVNDLSLSLFKPFVAAINAFIIKITTKNIDYNNLVKEELSFSLNFLDKYLNAHLRSNISIANDDDEKEIKLLIDRLSYIEKTKGREEVDLPMPKLSQSVSNKEKIEVNAQAFGQLLEDLIVAEGLIEEFFRTKGENSQDLEKVMNTLFAARGILQMTGKKDLAVIAKDCANVIEKVSKGISNVKPSLIKHTNAQIAAIVLYTQAIKNSNEEEANQIFQRILVLNKEYEYSEKEKLNDNILIDSVMIDKDPVTNMEIHNNKKEEIINPSIENTFIPEQTKINIDLPDLSSLELESDDVVTSNDSLEHENYNNINTSLTKSATFKDVSNNEELGEIFILEAEEVLENLYPDLISLKQTPKNQQLLTNIKRAFHTLKGSARMVDYKFVGESAWLVEQTLNKLIESDVVTSNSLIDMIEKSANLIKEYVQEISLSDDKSANVDLSKMFDLVYPFNNNLAYSNSIDEIIKINDTSIKSSNINNVNNKEIDKYVEIEKEVAQSRKVEITPIVEENLMEINFDNLSVNNKVIEDNVDINLLKEDEMIEENYLLINDVQIDKELFELFDTESDQLFDEIDVYFANRKIIDNDFVRYFHTLSSISKSVNINQLATIAYKVENIARISLEKFYEFQEEQLSILDESFDLMKEIKENYVALDEKEYNAYISFLDKICDDISRFELDQDNNVDMIDKLSEISSDFDVDVNVDEEDVLEQDVDVDVDVDVDEEDVLEQAVDVDVDVEIDDEYKSDLSNEENKDVSFDDYSLNNNSNNNPEILKNNIPDIEKTNFKPNLDDELLTYLTNINKEINNLKNTIFDLNQKLDSSNNKVEKQAKIINSFEEKIISVVDEKFASTEENILKNIKSNNDLIQSSLNILLKKEISTSAIENKIEELISKFQNEQIKAISAISEEIKNSNKQVLIQGIKLIRKDIDSIKK